MFQKNKRRSQGIHKWQTTPTTKQRLKKSHHCWLEISTLSRCISLKGGFPLLWLDYGSVTYSNSTTSFFQVTRMDFLKWRSPFHPCFKLTDKQIPKMGHERENLVLSLCLTPLTNPAPWHVRFKASYRQCMGTSCCEGSKLPGMFWRQQPEIFGADTTEQQKWQPNRPISLRHLREPSHSKQPLQWKRLLQDTSFFLRMTFRFLFPPTSKNHSTPSILGLDGTLTSSSPPGMWQVLLIRKPQTQIGKTESYPEQKDTSLSVANVALVKGIISSSDVLPASVESLVSRLQ